MWEVVVTSRECNGAVFAVLHLQAAVRSPHGIFVGQWERSQRSSHLQQMKQGLKIGYWAEVVRRATTLLHVIEFVESRTSAM